MPDQILKWMLAIALSLALPAASLAAPLKPRIVVSTDISPITAEPDDFESTIRLFVHADLFEIEGLVASTGWSNSGGRERPDLIHQIIGAYEKDLPNLRKISNQAEHLADESKQQLGYWPSPAYLRFRTVLGSAKMGFSFIGKDNNSAGSDLIIKLADEQDERPLWVLVWGGGNTLAQSIWKVQQERTPEQLKAFLRKLRVYTITDQDRPQRGGTHEFSSHFWMRKEFEKDLFFIWDESAWGFQNGTGKRNWDQYAEHIQNHGNLGAIYPKYRYGVEGDTPSFLYVWPNGLNDPEHPGFAGWGGTFAKSTCRDNTTVAFNNHAGPVRETSRKYETRFYPAIFNNFAARMDWAKNGAGNRNPVVTVNGNKDLAAIKLTPAQGASVTLDASASHDPDGDKLKFSWWVLSEAGSYDKNVKIVGGDSSRATIVVPADAGGKSFHVICEVTDDGTPNLTSYRRIIFEPTKETADTSNQSFAKWLKGYIPAAYSDAKMTDHGGWVQGRIPGLTASWAEWNEAGITLKKVHDIEEGELLFISKDKKENWPEGAPVVYFTGVGYYIAGYSAATMADWNVEKSTVVQFDGEAKKFVDKMVLARMKDQKSLVNWLKYYIPAQHPGATIQDHGGWVQAKLPGGLVASWAQWNEAGITLKGVEAHALKDGKSIFISKDKKENWADGPSVVYLPGAGYYIGGYASASMSGWNVEKSTIIQFSGDSKKFAEEMAKAWVAGK